MSSFKLERWPGAAVASNISDLAEIYAEVYAEPPYNGGDLWSINAFVERTTRQSARKGFSFFAALVENQVAGFSFGLPFAEGAWWSGEASDPPAALRASSKFAVIELVVRRQWRGMCIGHALLERLLQDRREKFAILTAMPDAPARQMYERWGWVQTGTAHHTPEAPVLDALALPLPVEG